jgi:hypothetical protein
LQVPLDSKLKELADIPYTISFIIRKRQQLDNLNELPKDKKPPESIIWDGDSDELEEWLENAFSDKKDNKIEFNLKPSEIEG